MYLSVPRPSESEKEMKMPIIVGHSRKVVKNGGVFYGDLRLVFFDGEDNGRIPEWDWILGSRAFVDSLQEYPDAVVIVDMVGDADLEIYWERNSDMGLNAAIWEHAAILGYRDLFIPEPKHSMLDDHTPFLNAGIPTVLVIDFDYPYWHTTQDTLDKISAASLQAVGDTILHWLVAFPSTAE